MVVKSHFFYLPVKGTLNPVLIAPNEIMACGFYRKCNPNHCQIKLTGVFVIAVLCLNLMLPLLSSNYLHC